MSSRSRSSGRARGSVWTARRTVWDGSRREPAPPARSRRRSRPWSRARRRLAAAAAVTAGFAAGLALEDRTWTALAARTPESFAAQRAAVVGCDRLAPDEVAAATGIVAGTTLDGLDASDTAARLGENPWVDRARVLPLPSGTVLIGVEERRAVALARLAADAPPQLLDEQAQPFGPAREEDLSGLPEIVAPEGSTPAPERLADGVHLALALAERPLPAAREIRLAEPASREATRLHLEGLSAPVLLGGGSLDEQLMRLERLLEAEPPELAAAAHVDVRFAERALIAMSPPRTGADQRRSRSEERERPTRDRAGAGDPEPGG